MGRSGRRRPGWRCPKPNWVWLRWTRRALLDDPAPNDAAAAAGWADLLVGLARTAHEMAVARWLAALVAERSGDPLLTA